MSANGNNPLEQLHGWLTFLDDIGCPGLPQVDAVKAVPAAERQPVILAAERTEASETDTMETGTLETVRQDLGDCQRCPLAEGRTNLVFGVGSPTADLMFVGEAPGRDEDLKGEPFVGRAGQLLTRIIEAIGLTRDDVYIANILKCRPPNNRDPLPAEVAACSPFLFRQIEVIKPRVVVALGAYAARTLLGTELAISKLRGRFHEYRGTLLMPTYHPAYLLRNPQAKRPVWEDMKLVRDLLDEGAGGDEG